MFSFVVGARLQELRDQKALELTVLTRGVLGLRLSVEIKAVAERDVQVSSSGQHTPVRRRQDRRALS